MPIRLAPMSLRALTGPDRLDVLPLSAMRIRVGGAPSAQRQSQEGVEGGHAVIGQQSRDVPGVTGTHWGCGTNDAVRDPLVWELTG